MTCQPSVGMKYSNRCSSNTESHIMSMSISKTYSNQRFSSWPCPGQICMQTDCISLWLNRKAFWGRGICSEKEMNRKGTGHLQYRREARSARVVMWVTVAVSPGRQSTDRVFPLPKMILLCPFPFRVCPTVQLTTFFFFISLPSDHICFQIAKQYNVIQPLRKTESRAQLHVSGRDNQIHPARWNITRAHEWFAENSL